jgi:hypothetical protein
MRAARGRPPRRPLRFARVAMRAAADAVEDDEELCYVTDVDDGARPVAAGPGCCVSFAQLLLTAVVSVVATLAVVNAPALHAGALGGGAAAIQALQPVESVLGRRTAAASPAPACRKCPACPSPSRRPAPAGEGGGGDDVAAASALAKQQVSAAGRVVWPAPTALLPVPAPAPGRVVFITYGDARFARSP